MHRLLIKFETNWADEVDIAGFHTVSTRAWEFFRKTITDADFPLTLGVGSNQEITYETPEKFWGCFTVKDISGVVDRIFIGNFKLPFGEFPMEQILTGLLDDEPERGIREEAWFMEEILPDYIP